MTPDVLARLIKPQPTLLVRRSPRPAITDTPFSEIDEQREADVLGKLADLTATHGPLEAARQLYGDHT